MNIRDLEYLLAVAKTKHFGKAAECCFVSQPTLSAQLKKLEETLGVQIFERTNRQVQVTSAGEDILKQAQRIMSEVAQLKNMASTLQDPYGGTLRLGMIPTVAPYLLPKILPAIKQHFPKLNLVIDENQTDTVVEKLKTGDLDGVILALPIVEESFESTLLFSEKFYAALPAGSPLSQRKKIRIADLENETLLLLADGHCLRDQALEACQFSGAKVKPGFEATSLETLRYLVAAGMGITLLPELAVQTQQPSNLSIVAFSDKPAPSRQIGLLWRKGSARTQCCDAIAKLIQQQVL